MRYYVVSIGFGMLGAALVVAILTRTSIPLIDPRGVLAPPHPATGA